MALPDTARLVEFDTALRTHCGDDATAMFRDPVVHTIRTVYAGDPHMTLTDALAWSAVQLWRDKCAVTADLMDVTYAPLSDLLAVADDTGEFVPVASVVATTQQPHMAHDPVGTVYDWQGRRLVPTTDPVDGANVVATDRGVMRYDPPVVTPAPTVNEARAAFKEWMGSDVSRENLYTSAGLPVPPGPTPRPSHMYMPPAPGEKFIASAGGSVGTYYCGRCRNGLHGYNDGTRGGSVSSWSTFGKCRCTGTPVVTNSAPAVSSKVPDGDAPPLPTVVVES